MSRIDIFLLLWHNVSQYMKSTVDIDIGIYESV